MFEPPLMAWTVVHPLASCMGRYRKPRWLL